MADATAALVRPDDPARTPTPGATAVTGPTRTRQPRARRVVPLAALVLLVLLVARLPLLRLPLGTQDEAIILVYAQQLLDGRLPHRDVYTVYGPGVFGLTAGSFLLLGPTLVAERLVGLLLQAVLVGGVLGLTLDRGRRAAFVAGVGCVVVLTPLGLVAYAWVAGLACIVWGLVLLRRDAVVAAGVVLGLAALFRPEMVLPAYAAAVPLALGWSRARRLLVGAVVGLAPSVLYYGWIGRQAVDNIVLQRGLVDARLAPDASTIALVVLSAVVVVVLLVAAVRARRADHWSFAVLAIVTVPQLLQRTDLDHLAFVLAVPLPLALVALGDLVGRSGPLVTTARVALLACLAALVAQAPGLHARGPATTYAVGDRSVVLTVEDARLVDVARRAALAVAPSGSSVFVGVEEMARPSVSPVLLYLLLPELRADAYYLELPVGATPTVGRALARDVAGADVLLLAHVPVSASQAFAPFVPRGPGDADAVVRARFCRQTHTDLVDVLAPCRSAGDTAAPADPAAVRQ